MPCNLEYSQSCCYRISITTWPIRIKNSRTTCGLYGWPADGYITVAKKTVTTGTKFGVIGVSLKIYLIFFCFSLMQYHSLFCLSLLNWFFSFLLSLIFLLIPVSLISSGGHVGAGHHPWCVGAQTHRVEEAYLQLLHAGVHVETARFIPIHSAPARQRHWTHQTSAQTTILRHLCHYTQQPAPTQGHVLVEQRAADQVLATRARYRAAAFVEEFLA